MLPALLLAVSLFAGPSPDEIFVKADTLVKESKFDEAEKLLRDGMQANPRANGFHLALGRVLETRSKTAEAYYEYTWEVLRAGSAQSAADAKAATKALRANDRTQQGDEIRKFFSAAMTVDKDALAARAALEKLRAERGDRFVVRYFYAEASMHCQKFDDALSTTRALMREDPGFAPAAVLEAMLLRILGHQSEAEAAAARAKKNFPGHFSLDNLQYIEKPKPTLPPVPTPVPSPTPAASP